MAVATSQGSTLPPLQQIGSLIGDESGKAIKYLKELEQARSQCMWKDVPELARKVQKHAPHRHLLVLAERSEVEAINFLHQRSGVTRPATPTSKISALVPSLREAIDDQASNPFDNLRANVVLGWILWILNEPALALERLSSIDFDAIAEKELKDQDMRDRKHETVIEGYLLKGSTQESIDQPDNAIGTYISSLPYLASILSSNSTPKLANNLSPQLHRWMEQILSRLCGLLNQRIQSLTVDEQGKALEAFRLWAKFCNFQPIAGNVDVKETGIVSGVKRRDVWHAYYNSLSVILRHDIRSSDLISSFGRGTDDMAQENFHVRRAQRAELKRIETCYESLLLEETRFPKANERNDEVERWVGEVITNWRVFVGPQWEDEELGEGGKAALGKDVLEILYRAATKTFHSTQILRHLFTVHAWLGEFDIAFKAFGSYIDIVKKGQARAEKSGERQVDLDDADTVLFTAAKAIELLCHYGSRAEVERSLDICQDIEHWLSKLVISPRTTQIAYRAMGIGRATWARLTYENTSRSTIQAEGVQYLGKAIEPDSSKEEDLKSAFALSLLLAETRDLQSAINLIKDVIAMSNSVEKSSKTGDPESESSNYMTERRLCSLWHLLALLLSSRSDFAAAERLCDAAFEQFGEHTDLFGQREKNQAGADGETVEKDMAYRDSSRTSKGIVDQMEANEKEGLIQIKMTQLALLEVTEGPVAAIELSHELLAVYGRLFGDPAQTSLPSRSQGKESIPKTSSSTIKSFGGSIVGRPKSSRRKLERNSTLTNRPKGGSLASRPSTAETQAVPPPLIQVIGENGERSEGVPVHRHSHLPFRKTPRDGDASQPSDPTRPKSYPAWERRGNDQASRDVNSPNANNEKQTPVPSSNGGEVQNGRNSAGGPDQPLPRIPHNMPPTTAPPPPGHSDQPPRQDTRLPSSPTGVPQYSPEPRFVALQEYRRKTSLLVNVWLFIAGLYTRATLGEDASSAIDEAQKLVEGLEMQVAQESSSGRAFAERGWGLGSSVDELWADVYAERGVLAESSESPHEALAAYEQALAYFPDHPAAIVSLSGILLDIYCQKISPEPSEEHISSLALSKSNPTLVADPAESDDEKGTRPNRTSKIDSPEVLNRLAARDRAYSLLSTLTKLGTGWDNSEAWYMLARAYEESGQIEKAKEVLWWCVELEDGRPLRPWRSVGTGSFVL